MARFLPPSSQERSAAKSSSRAALTDAPNSLRLLHDRHPGLPAHKPLPVCGLTPLKYSASPPS